MSLPEAYWLREGTPLPLSKTALETWQRCPREFAYRYCHELDGRGNQVQLIRGIAWGQAMAAWWGCADVGARWEVARGVLQASPEFAALGAVQKLVVHAMLEVYNEVNADVRVNGIVFPEEILVGPLTELAYSRVRADLVIDFPERGPFIVEFKSTEQDISEDSWFWEKLRWDPQVMGYWNSAPDMRLVYDVTKVPTLTPEKATPVESRKFYVRGSRDGKFGPGDPMPGTRLADEPLDEFYARLVTHLRTHRFSHFARQEIRASDRDKSELSLDMAAWSRQITDAATRDEWPHKVGSCRRGKQGWCTFYHSCFGDVPPEVNQLYKRRERN